jgi:hypothetical protein
MFAGKSCEAEQELPEGIPKPRNVIGRPVAADIGARVEHEYKKPQGVRRRGRRILVYDMLGELGHTLAAEAGHIGQALELARSAEFELAILDVNLSGVSWSRPWPS